MAEERKRENYGSYSSDAASLELYDEIKKLAELARVEKPLLTYDELLFKLRRWWCNYYKRPYKDPLLDSYTFEELLFEYYDIVGTKEDAEKAEEEAKEVPQEEHDWAAEEEAKEIAEALARQQAQVERKSDTIVEEAVGLTDEAWAAKHEKVLNNPSADQVDSEGGDISATFEG